MTDPSGKKWFLFSKQKRPRWNCILLVWLEDPIRLERVREMISQVPQGLFKTIKILSSIKNDPEDDTIEHVAPIGFEIGAALQYGSTMWMVADLAGTDRPC